MTIHNNSQILVVDDSGPVRSIVIRLLAQLGFTDVDEANDGNTALAKIKEKHYGFVISDWNMEPMNGQALLEHVRAEEKYENLPFIMMTAEPLVSKLVQARHAGVSSFINKPFNAEALQAKISQLKAGHLGRQTF